LSSRWHQICFSLSLLLSFFFKENVWTHLIGREIVNVLPIGQWECPNGDFSASNSASHSAFSITLFSASQK
jgi:hypothetical protein